MSVECRDDIVETGTGTGAVAEALLGHYDMHARDLPWRVSPAARRAGLKPDPYRVWLSEVMLQQTTVAAVPGYFERFTTRWPTVEALATAPQEDVLAAWAGLGYYARARNLIACARAVTVDHGGRFPGTEAGLRVLPGIGDYTAAAVAAIAFDEPAAVVDANVERVVARLFAITTSLPAARPEIRKYTAEITPRERPGDFAQAMMDLGATICTVRNPSCLLCPLAPHCAAHAQGIAESLPVKPPKKAKPQRTGTAFWIEQDGQVLLVQRPGKGMLGGMRALPDDGWAAGRNGTAQPPVPGQWQVIDGAVAHVFTHFSLELALALYRGPQIDKVAIENLNGIWWPVEHIAAAGLPTLFAKAAALAIQYR
ncbi:MAG: A/G-specific adenine glycosylase [Blastomonas sp.]|uniref:A/G-specific adenine glycosylase n=1 Tax=Blastomonas sp. TaxID=1909299 RepID=UPI0008C2926A|nr:A/G-specific adenine glycosylase [Blastomonas sp.]OHD01708.1 MAG: A/G-specific adenine glycosylase [Sphingopyxis sp. RIFCSPHIGHO2_01_FULL_65_24]